MTYEQYERLASLYSSGWASFEELKRVIKGQLTLEQVERKGRVRGC